MDSERTQTVTNEKGMNFEHVNYATLNTAAKSKLTIAYSFTFTMFSQTCPNFLVTSLKVQVLVKYMDFPTQLIIKLTTK